MRKHCIAHRGASAYAPEHTLAAYRLAIAQGADYVEQDLAVTRDGVLICLHDDSLERTTDVAEVFPDRATAGPETGARQWLAADFTSEEIRRLDAGRWFDARFAGERIPTWEEAVAAAGPTAGLYPELKSPARYADRGIDIVGLFAASLRALGLDRAPASRLIVQTFDAGTLREVARELPALARVFLIDDAGAGWLSPEGLSEIATFATGIGPGKTLVDGRPEIAGLAHARGLTVTPYTVTSKAPSRFADVEEEMRYYLFEIGADALFTDNPDRFPRPGP